MANICDKCGKNLALVGTRHNCIANTIANTTSVANIVANKPEIVANEIYARYRDKDARREYMREYMRKKRAK